MPRQRTDEPANEAQAVLAGQQPDNARALVAVKTAVGQLDHDLKQRLDDLTTALAGRLPPDYFASVALTQFRKNPGTLQEVAGTSQGRASFVAAVIQAGELGLPFLMGRAYLVPFRNHGVREVQLIVGYQGLVDLITGPETDVTYVDAAVVHAKDYFEYQRGTGGYLRHREYQPEIDVAAPQADWVYDRGPVTHVWARVVYANGQDRWDVMRYAEIEVIRLRAPGAGSKDSPWVSDYDEMAKKTVLRRLAKTQRISLQAMKVIDSEDDWEAQRGLTARQVGTDAGAAQATQSRLSRQLQANLGGRPTDEPAAEGEPQQQPATDRQQQSDDPPPPTDPPAGQRAQPAPKPAPTQPATAEPAEQEPVDGQWVAEGGVVADSATTAQPVQKPAKVVDMSGSVQSVCGATVVDDSATYRCTLAPGHRGGHSDGHHDWPRQ